LPAPFWPFVPIGNKAFFCLLPAPFFHHEPALFLVSSGNRAYQKKNSERLPNGAGKRLNGALFCAEWGSIPPFASPISTMEKRLYFTKSRGKKNNQRETRTRAARPKPEKFYLFSSIGPRRHVFPICGSGSGLQRFNTTCAGKSQTRSNQVVRQKIPLLSMIRTDKHLVLSRSTPNSALQHATGKIGGSLGKPEARSTRERFRLSSRLREVSRRAYEARLLILFAYCQIKALAILKCRGVDLFSLFEKVR
jgi:hypothetical protein